jgi:hypothetical protein
VTSNSYLSFKTYGLDSTAKLLLQYSDDSSFVSLNLPVTWKEDSCYVVNYNLRDGQNCNFRILMVGGDTNKVFKQHLIIDGIPTLDTLDYTVYLDKPIIQSVPKDKKDANTIILDVTPIPAKDIVYVTAQLPENILAIYETKELQIKLITFDGKELLSVNANSGVTKSISLEKFAQGIYFICAEASDLLLKESVLPAVKQIVIER